MDKPGQNLTNYNVKKCKHIHKTVEKVNEHWTTVRVLFLHHSLT